MGQRRNTRGNCGVTWTGAGDKGEWQSSRCSGRYNTDKGKDGNMGVYAAVSAAFYAVSSDNSEERLSTHNTMGGNKVG